jgi:hypothetical protein
MEEVSMISTTKQISNNISINQEIDLDIQKALQLIDDAKKQNSKTTVNQLNDLLIEYILANMKGDSIEAKAIQDQISQLMQTYEKNLQQADDLVSKLNKMEKNPGINLSNDLAYLQNLIAALKTDVASGNISNLNQFNAQTSY